MLLVCDRRLGLTAKWPPLFIRGLFIRTTRLFRPNPEITLGRRQEASMRPGAIPPPNWWRRSRSLLFPLAALILVFLHVSPSLPQGQKVVLYSLPNQKPERPNSVTKQQLERFSTRNQNEPERPQTVGHAPSSTLVFHHALKPDGARPGVHVFFMERLATPPLPPSLQPLASNSLRS